MTATNPLDAARDEPRLQRAAVEIPTLVLILAVYSSWFALTYQYGSWPLWVVAPLTALLLTLHSSLQHEIVHGHPTRSRSINRLFGLVPLSLWLPFERYRHTHRSITSTAGSPIRSTTPSPTTGCPSTGSAPARSGACCFRLSRRLPGASCSDRSRTSRTSFAWTSVRSCATRAACASSGSSTCCGASRSCCGCSCVCGMPIWVYALTMVVPALSVLLIRSFAEHRARPGVLERTAIVEGSWILGPLFLFNNLHACITRIPRCPGTSTTRGIVARVSA